MKNSKALIILLLTSSILLIIGCSSGDDDSNTNTSPSLFSSNTSVTKVDGATIVWTESLDLDGDPVTYAIILEGNEIASGGTTLTYSFSGLEFDTVYQGYVEARDGNGGTSRADFFFTTNKIIQIQYRDFIVDTRHVVIAYFEIPESSGAVSYSLSVSDYSLNTIPATIGRTYTWSPEDNIPTGNNVGTGSSGLTEFSPDVYHANTHVSSVGVGSSALAGLIDYYAAITGTAELTIYR